MITQLQLDKAHFQNNNTNRGDPEAIKKQHLKKQTASLYEASYNEAGLNV